MIKEFYGKKLTRKYHIDEFIPVRLDEAIKYRGLDYEEAADKLNISEINLKKVLMQGIGVTDELILTASNVFDFPVGYFFKPLPPRSIYVDGPLFID